VVKRCITPGTVPARQVVPQAPWIMQRTDLGLPAVQAVGQRVRLGHRQAYPQAGAEQVAVAPAATRHATLLSGDRG
jgi:hypothetical protein